MGGVTSKRAHINVKVANRQTLHAVLFDMKRSRLRNQFSDVFLWGICDCNDFQDKLAEFILLSTNSIKKTKVRPDSQ